MDRIGPAGGAPTALIADGQQGWVDQNLLAGQQGTNCPALYMNALMEEVLNVITAAGITPNINVWTQLLTAIGTLITGAVAAYVNSGGFFYFILSTVGGPNLIICGGPCVIPTGTASINQILPITFQTAFKGGVCADNGASGWGYGVQPGGDLSHCTIQCPVDQINGSGISPRPTAATGYFICVGY
jgi:hypothetical protein